MNTLRKIDREFQTESIKQSKMIYAAVAHVLYYVYGWKELRILRLFDLTEEVCAECAEFGTRKSMLEMLEDETGIEMCDPEKKSYHEYKYLDASTWDGREPTKMQFIFIRKQQIKWIPQMYIAAFCICLHRKYGYGFDRLSQFVEHVQRIRFETGVNYKDYKMLLDGIMIDVDAVFQNSKEGVKNG